MRSHLIPYGPDSGIWDTDLKRGYRKFLKQRLDLICKAFDSQAGMRLFREG
jgi:hypothetical protein